jgi:hypothetical protein
VSPGQRGWCKVRVVKSCQTSAWTFSLFLGGHLYIYICKHCTVDNIFSLFLGIIRCDFISKD